MDNAVAGKLRAGTGLIRVFRHAVTREEALRLLAGRLYESGYVRETYVSAILEREKEYPTGLPTVPVGVAIPHTDAEHVHRSALAVGILAEPVSFQEMGSADSEVPVHVISMMAIADPGSVMPILRTLALAYQDQAFLTQLKDAADEQTVLDLLQARIPDVIDLA